ncbi:MAG: EAL domain-containing protein [Myxococcota bacterium]
MRELKVHHPFASLRGRLLLLVALAVVPAWGLMLHTAREQRSMASRVVREDALRVARGAAANQDRLIEGARQLLTTLALLPNVRSADPRACGILLATLLGQFPGYVNFGVIAPNGELLCSALPAPPNLNLADRSYFRGALVERGFVVGEYQVGRITGVASVNFGYPIIDEHGVVTAVVFAAMDLRWLNRFAAETELPEGASLSVVDRNGVILARHPDPEHWVGAQLPEAPLVQRIRAQAQGGTAEAQGLDGVMRLYGFTPLPSGPAVGVFLSVGMPRQAVYAHVDEVFRRSLLGLALVALLALLAAWVGGNVFILRQVNALVAATRRLAAGDLGARTGMGAGRGELHLLAHAFDEMAATLQTRETEARRAAEEIRLLQSMTMAISTAPDLHASLATALRMICEATGWKLGQAWMPNPDGTQLECSPGWYVQAQGLEAFRAASQRHVFAKGEGLPGRAWDRKTPVWVEDVTTDTQFLRLAVARRGGIKCGLAIPVLDGDAVVAVLEFFMFEPRPADQRLERLVFALGSQLGAVIQRKRAEDSVRHLAFYDPVTNLPNRLQLEERLRAALARAQRAGEPCSLLVVTLERFEEIKYTLGQANAELLLKGVGPRMAAVLRSHDVAASLGGPSFAVLLPGQGAHAAAETAVELVREFERPFEIAGFTVEVGANIGIATFPGHGEDAAVLMRRADVALRQAQQAGVGFRIYDAERDPYNPRRLQLMGELRTAIGERQLLLYCQPKLDLHTREIVAMEALVRWRHPEQGLVSPDQFVPLIESTGLIGPVTQWMLDAALMHCHTLQSEGIRVPLAVNLSARNLADAHLVETVQHALATWGGEPDWLDLEITEGAIMADPQVALETLQHLSRLGFRLAVDDFGTGHSSLAYLQKLPLDALKIDKAFVLPMLRDEDAACIVRSTVELGHNLGLRVIAEGVENREICEALARLGCDEAQGYYLTPPIPADQFGVWLKTVSWPIRQPAPARRGVPGDGALGSAHP